MMNTNTVAPRGCAHGGQDTRRPTRYDKGDTTRGRGRVQDGKGSEERALFTTSEAAAQLGIAPATVKDAIMRGTLEYVPIHPRLNMVTREAIEKYRRDHLGQQGRPKGTKKKAQASTTAGSANARGAEREADRQPGPADKTVINSDVDLELTLEGNR